MSTSNSNGQNIEKVFDQITTNLEVLGAIMALEYHDKNHLSGDNESRCRKQREIVTLTYRLVYDLKLSMMVSEPKTGRPENY